MNIEPSSSQTSPVYGATSLKWVGQLPRRIQRIPRATKLALSLLVLTVVAFAAIAWWRSRPTVLRIAYFGRNTESTLEELHRFVLAKYISELNQRLRGVRFEIKFFDIHDNPDELVELYETEIGPDSRYVAAIDNTWGRHLRPAATTIRRFSVPVIAINADKRGADFGGHALFFGHGDNVPDDVAGFVNKVLSSHRVTFIAEAGYDLTNGFRDRFSRAGITVEREILVPTDAVTPRDSVALFRALAAVAPELDSQVIVLNMHGEWGARTIAFLDAHAHDATFVGGAYVAAGLKNFQWGRNRNQMLLLTDPNDALPERIFTEIRAFRETRPELFNDVNLNVPLYVKRCLDAVSVIEGVAAPRGRRVQRQDFVRFFRRLRGETLKTPYDLYEFDQNLLFQNELTWERHARGKVASYPYQLNRSGEQIANVNFGIELLDVTNLNFNENTFDAELYYWLTLDARYLKTENLIHFRNVRRESSDKLLIERHMGDVVYRLYRKSGSFAADFNLSDFPLDAQSLVIGVEIINPSDSVRISFDYKSFAQSRAGRGEFHIPAWNVRDSYVSVDNLITTSLRGDPTVDDEQAQKFKSLNVRVNVERRFLPPFIGYVLPLVMIGAVALSLLFLHDISFGTIGDVSVGVFLSIITYSVSYATSKPESSVLTKADFLFYVTFLTVLSVFLLLVVVNSSPIAKDPNAPLNRRIRVLRYALAAGYLAAIIIIPLS